MINNMEKGLLNEAASLQMEGEFLEAEQLYESLLNQNPENAVALNNLGMLYLQTDRLDQAMDVLINVTTLHPKYATAWKNLGNVYSAKGKIELAIHALSQSFILDDSDPECSQMLAQLLDQSGDHVHAEEFWLKSIDLTTLNAELYLNLANNLNLQQKFNGTRDIMEKIIYEHQDNALAWQILGTAYFGFSNFGDAIKCFKRALGLEPENIKARQSLAFVWLKLGEQQNAINEFRRILLLQSDNTEARNNLAILELAADETESALNHFNLTLAQEPENAKALYYKSVILLLQGKTDEARQTLAATIATNHVDYKAKAEEMLATMN